VRGHRYYFPGALGAERDMAERLRRWWGPKYAPKEPRPPSSGPAD
jgi:hypothetical protein